MVRRSFGEIGWSAKLRIQKTQEDAAMMGMDVRRYVGDALARWGVDRIEVSSAGRCEADILRLFRDIFEDQAAIRSFELHPVLFGNQGVGRCCISLGGKGKCSEASGQGSDDGGNRGE